MAKLIRSSIECGYKLMGLCLHDSIAKRKLVSAKTQCIPKGEENFPKYCPLEDGYTKSKKS